MVDMHKFDPEEAKERAWRNMVVSIHGDTKVGKTFFSLRSQGPRYVAFLDSNNTLDAHLLKAAKDGWDSDVFDLRLPPVPYDQLTQAEAEKRVRAVDTFILDAQGYARELVEDGKPGGTFILDGTVYYKGYLEKWFLGDSATLGFKPKKDGDGILPIQYGVTNTRVKQMVAGFGGQYLDAVFIWEGRRQYRDVMKGNREVSEATNLFSTKQPDAVAGATNAMLELVVVKEDIVVNQKVVGRKLVHRVVIGYNSFDSSLYNQSFELGGFAELKELLLEGIDKPGVPAEGLCAIADHLLPLASIGVYYRPLIVEKTDLGVLFDQRLQRFF